MKETEVELGLKNLIEAIRQYADSSLLKVRDMHINYIASNKNKYDEIETMKLQYFLNSYLYKFYIANMHLEQLWSLANKNKMENNLVKILKNIFDVHNTSNDNTVLYSFILESYLVQTTAFYHFYELYLCSFFQIEKQAIFQKKN